MKDLDMLVKKAKLKMFTNELFFFGISSNKFKWEIENLEDHIEGMTIFSRDDLSKIENGTIYFNKNYLEKDDYTSNNFVFLICHELLHILNKHGIRAVDKIWPVWCAACDHVIECFLKNMSNIIKPYQDQYNIIPDLEIEKPNCSADQAYEWLIKKTPIIKIEEDPNSGIITVSKNDEIIFDTHNIMGGGSGKSEEDEGNDLNNQIEQIVAEARAIFENIKARGFTPGRLVEYLDKILQVEIPWQQLLEKAIKTNVIMKPDERGWTNLNKMYIPHKITLPGYTFSESREGVGILVIGVDSSGSINTKNLREFAGVIEKSMMYFKTIKMIVHDVAIHQIREFSNDNIHEFYEFISKIGFKGRGGTSHKFLFDEVAKIYDSEDRDDLSMVLSLTDGYSDIQRICNNYKWINDKLPLVIVLTKNARLINLPEDKDITQIKIQ
jgi:predicted metal-dependent peptidase